MSTHIREIINDEGSSVTFDTRLANKLEEYYTAFISRNGEHAEFFGGHLTGSARIAFLPSNENAWWDILGMDREAVYERFRAAMQSYEYMSPRQDPPIKLDWKISTDPMNQVSTWLMHRFYNANDLKEEYRIKGMVHAYLIMQVRFLTSKIHVHWRNPCSKDVAESVYTAMSGQYLIKRRGTWRNLLYTRAVSSTVGDEETKEPPNFIDVIKTMGDDKRIADFLNDAKSFISGQIENIYGFHKKVMSEGMYNVVTLGSIVDKGGDDGGTKLRERVSQVEMFTNYLLGIIGDEPSFIKKSLVTTVCQTLVRRCRPASLETVLAYVSKNWMAPQITVAVKELLLHAFENMSNTRGGIDRTLTVSQTLMRLKGVYTASKANDELIKLRAQFEVFVTESTHVSNPADKAAIRTAVMLYIVARTLIKDTMT